MDSTKVWKKTSSCCDETSARADPVAYYKWLHESGNWGFLNLTLIQDSILDGILIGSEISIIANLLFLLFPIIVNLRLLRLPFSGIPILHYAFFGYSLLLFVLMWGFNKFYWKNEQHNRNKGLRDMFNEKPHQ